MNQKQNNNKETTLHSLCTAFGFLEMSVYKYSALCHPSAPLLG